MRPELVTLKWDRSESRAPVPATESSLPASPPSRPFRRLPGSWTEAGSTAQQLLRTSCACTVPERRTSPRAIPALLRTRRVGARSPSAPGCVRGSSEGSFDSSRRVTAAAARATAGGGVFSSLCSSPHVTGEVRDRVQLAQPRRTAVNTDSGPYRDLEWGHGITSYLSPGRTKR